MVLYVKDGQPFTENSFSQTLASIRSNITNNGSGFDETATGLDHLNCIDTQADGTGTGSPYVISEDDSNLFGVHVYGNGTNPQTLWGVNEWNINLLRSARNKVYVQRGNQWQAYMATDYFATLPASYGGKPAIYLYPTQKQTIKVEIHPQGQLTKTDQLYNQTISGWSVTADSNGTINNSQNSLYYEAMLPVPTPEGGYSVPYNDLFTFSKSYVQKLGLNQTESREFIKFWQQKLPYSPYYFVSHLDLNTINKIYPLEITPKPDDLLRVELYFKPLLQAIPVKAPRYPTVNQRKGFTAVEWGGILSQQ